MARRATAAIAILIGLTAGCERISALLDRGDAPPEEAQSESATDESAQRGALSAIPESEPNDTPESAQRVSVGRPIEGAVSGTDADVFSLSAGVQAASLVVSGDGVELVELHRPQDGATALYEPQQGRVEVANLDREASTLITIRGQGAYTLLVSDADEPARCGLLREPDDIARPGLIMTSVPASAVACIESPTDLDVLRIAAESLADVQGFALAVSGVEGVALEARIKASDGRVLLAVSGDEGQEIVLPNVAAGDGRDVFVEIRSLSGANESLPYRASIRRLPPLNGVIELEPNDAPESATRLTEIGLVNGYLHRAGDEDHYELTTEEPMLARLLASPPQSVDLRLSLSRGPDAALVVDAAGPGGQEQICAIRLGPSSPIAFSVSGRPADLTVTEPYLLHFERLAGGDWEREPNDTLSEALASLADLPPAPELGVWTDAGPSAVASGYVFPDADVDTFVIEVPADPSASATYSSVTVNLEANGQADYSLEIVDEDGASLGRSDSGRIGESEAIALDLPSGRYGAIVRRLSGDACSRPYRLTVKKTDFPDPLLEGDGVVEGSGDGSGDEAAEEAIRRVRSTPRVLPRNAIRPPPTGSSPPVQTRPRTWGAPTRTPGQQPPRYGGSTSP